MSILTRQLPILYQLATLTMHFAVVLAALYSTARASHVLHERRESPLHTSWRQAERVQPDAIIPLRIGLKQNNLDAGAQRLAAVSHPDSEQYGQHLTADEVHDLFAPSEHTVDTYVQSEPDAFDLYARFKN